MLCRKCHTLNEIDNRFCAGCGVDLAEQARQAGKIRPNRLGCLGCLGLFAVLAVILVVAVFFYLKTSGIIYHKPGGRWAMTYVTTIDDPLLYQSNTYPHDPKDVLNPAVYRADAAPVVFRSSVPPIQMFVRYVGLHLNGDAQFEARTYKVLPRAQGAAYVEPVLAATSSSHPDVLAGYRFATFALFDPGFEPEPGEYLTRIFVNGKPCREATFFIDDTLPVPAPAGAEGG